MSDQYPATSGVFYSVVGSAVHHLVTLRRCRRRERPAPFEIETLPPGRGGQGASDD